MTATDTLLAEAAKLGPDAYTTMVEIMMRDPAKSARRLYKWQRYLDAGNERRLVRAMRFMALILKRRVEGRNAERLARRAARA